MPPSLHPVLSILLPFLKSQEVAYIRLVQRCLALVGWPHLGARSGSRPVLVITRGRLTTTPGETERLKASTR